MSTHIESRSRRSDRSRGIGRLAVALAVLGVAWFGVLPGAVGQGLGRERPIAAIMCRYADAPNTYSIEASRIENMFVGPGSIDELVREVSLDTVSHAGSRAFGWFTLPNPTSSYPDSWEAAGNLARDCAAAARAGGVDLSPFTYLAVFVNAPLAGAEGRSVTIDFGGRAVPPGALNTMMMNHRGLTSPGLVLHELGHVLGGDHTTSAGDPLGGAAWYGSNVLTTTAPYRTNNVTPGWDAHNRDRMGFVPAGRKATFAGGTQQFGLSRLNQPVGNGPMIVEVPIAGGHKYVIAARTQTGVDGRPVDPNMPSWYRGLPTAGVTIQRVGDGAPSITSVMSTPGGDYRAAAGVWLPGQTYTDAANGISITVNSFDDNGAQITVASGVTAPPAGGGGGGAAATPTAAPQPTPTPPPASSVQGNDLEAAVRVSVPSTTGPRSTAGATTQAGEPSACGGIAGTVWHAFTATESGTVTISTAGSNFDTALVVSRGPATNPTFGALTHLGCNDDANGTSQSSLQLPVNAGDTYYIQVGGFRGVTGTLVLDIRGSGGATPAPAATATPLPAAPAPTPTPVPVAPAPTPTPVPAAPAPTPTPVPAAPAPAAAIANNDLAAAARVTLPFTLPTTNTTGATLQGDNEPRPCGGIGSTLWFRVEVAAAGRLTISTIGSGFDTAVAAYRGPAADPTFGALTLLGCNDDADGGAQSRLQVDVNAGDVVYVQAGGYAATTGNLVVDIR